MDCPVPDPVITDDSPQRSARLEALLQHTARLLPEPQEVDAFRRAMVAEPAVDVRLNTLLPGARAIAGPLRERCTPAPWCAESLRLPPDLAAIASHSLEFRLGALYLQARAPTLAVATLDPQPGELVLDLAAAPGGKATQIAAAMGNTGLLVANEPRGRRQSSLVGNLERCGAANTLITTVLGAEMARLFHNLFDRVLLDAPCSGDGILCKDRHMLDFWSVEDARKKGVQQVGLLRAAYHMLRPGGRLVYSTCSLSTEENEEVLAGLLRRYPEATVERVPLPDGGLAEEVAAGYPESLAGAARVWPHRHDTEGAFVAAIGKPRETEWEVVTEDAGERLRDEVSTPDPQPWRQRLAQRWEIDLPVPPGFELATDHRYLHLRPAAAAHLLERDWVIRCGMRVAGLHRDHYFLTQQAIALWGDQVRTRRLEIDGDQVRRLFDGETCPVADAPLTGEVVCVHDGWPVARGVVSRDGTTLTGYLPKVVRTARLTRLLP
jgi:16S rRNA (cytosine1407-C5)-methyltransferase